MYIKTVKKAGKKYKYYYHNIGVNNKIKNIFLANNKRDKRRIIANKFIKKFNVYYLGKLSLVVICLVDIPSLILKNNSSYVQTKQFNFNASATNSTSLICPFNNCLDLGIKSLYSFNGTNLITPNIKDTNSLNSDSESLDLNSISSLLLKNSSFNFSGANNSIFLLNINFITSPCDINVLNNTFESITTFNYINPSSFRLLCIESLTFLDNKSASFSVNLDLNTIFMNLFKISSRLISSTNSSLANSDQFTQDNLFISDLTSSGIANVIDAIYNPPILLICSNFFNCLILRIIMPLNTSDHFTLGNSSIFFFNSSEIDNVMVAILVPPPLNYVYIHKYVDIYKAFGLEKEVKCTLRQ